MNYIKPVVLSLNDVAEGVYAASGAVPTSGTGSNISWSFREDGNHDSSSHAAEEPHPIRKYNIEIPAYMYGQLLHFTMDCRGPIRHAGFHHQIEETVVRTGNHVEGDFRVSANNKKYMYVCVDPEYAPEGFEIISASVSVKE